MLHLYDGRDRRIRTVSSEAVLPPGDHALEWDGRDLSGRKVPSEAYVYTLEARGTTGEEHATWDITDGTGGDVVAVEDLAWDPEEGVVRYHLTRAGRVRIRVGLQGGGPLLKTLIDWVPRPAGVNEEAWDGYDAAGVLELSRHPKLALSARGFALSRNTVLVGARPPSVQLIDDLPDPAVYRKRTRTVSPRMFDYAHQAIETRSDYRARLVLPEASAEREGVPLVRGPTPVQVDVPPELFARVMDERCEASFYVDGRFAFERETGFLPMTWTWDPKNSPPGLHYLTVNLRGYDGHFGVGTVKVRVADPTPPES